MNSEVVSYYILHAIFGIGGSFQAYLVGKNIQPVLMILFYPSNNRLANLPAAPCSCIMYLHKVVIWYFNFLINLCEYTILQKHEFIIF